MTVSVDGAAKPGPGVCRQGELVFNTSCMETVGSATVVAIAELVRRFAWWDAGEP